MYDMEFYGWVVVWGSIIILVCLVVLGFLSRTPHTQVCSAVVSAGYRGCLITNGPGVLDDDGCSFTEQSANVSAINVNGQDVRLVVCCGSSSCSVRVR